MPTAVLHDGTRLNFPDGTDPDVIQSTVQSVLASRSGAPATPPSTPTPTPPAKTAPEGFLTGSEGPLERTRLGLANVGISGYLGAKQLLGNLSDEDKQVLAMSNSDLSKSGFAGKAANLAGNVAGGVATSMIAPQVAIPKYLKAALSSAALAGVETPVDASDAAGIAMGKLKEAGKAAIAGPAAVALGSGVAKVGTGMFKATQDAIDLIRQGIHPTLQQGAAGPLGRWIGGLTSGFTNVRNRQEQEVLNALDQRISKGQVALPEGTLNERVDLLNKGLDQEYGGILGNKKFPMNNSIRDAALGEADALKKSGGRFIDEQAQARAILDNIIGSDRNATRLSDPTLRGDYLDRIQSAISPSNPQLVNEALVNAKNVITQKSRNARLTPDELDSLKDVDSRFFDLMRLNDLRKGGAGHETGVDIRGLANAYGNAPGQDVIGATNKTAQDLVGPLVRTLGSTPRQDEARTALNTIRRIGAPVGIAGAAAATGSLGPLTAAVAPLYALSAAGQSAKGAKALLGQYPIQQNLKAALESPQTGEFNMANILRALRDNSSNLGAGLTPGQ